MPKSLPKAKAGPAFKAPTPSKPVRDQAQMAMSSVGAFPTPPCVRVVVVRRRRGFGG